MCTVGIQPLVRSCSWRQELETEGEGVGGLAEGPFRPVDLPNVKPTVQSEQGLIEAEASPGVVASAGPWPWDKPEFCVVNTEG